MINLLQLGSCLIVSAELRSEFAKDNRHRTVLMANRLTELGVPFMMVVGAYQEVEETSFVVPLSATKTVATLAKSFGQESYLEISNGKGILFFGEGRTEPLGQLTCGNSYVYNSNYTYDVTNGVYYTFS